MSRTLFAALGLSLLAASASAQAPTEAARAEARERFERALGLFDEGRFEEARIEFEAAYAAVPSFEVLYNIGNVHASLLHPVEAVEAWGRYLAQGGDAIPARRRREVEAAIERQRGRIGALRVTSNVEGATVTLDGVAVATLPLEAPIPLAVGVYAVGVEAAGWQASSRRVEIAGAHTAELEVRLERVAEERGTIEVRSPLTGVEVLIDGVTVGTTPLSETLAVPAGRHLVEARRAGYLPLVREVRLEATALARVELSLQPDPQAPPEALATLELRAPAQTALRIDGEPARVASLTLPVGPHVIDVTAPERQPVRDRVDLRPGERRVYEPTFRWTDAARRARIDGADQLRVAGAVLASTGGAAFLALGATAIWNETRVGELEGLRPDYEACRPGATGACSSDMESNAQRYLDGSASVDLVRQVVYPLAAAGLVAAAIGLVLVAVAPSDAAIDASASVRLVLRPGALEVEGAF